MEKSLAIIAYSPSGDADNIDCNWWLQTIDRKIDQRFTTKEEAVEFCKKRRLPYQVAEDQSPAPSRKVAIAPLPTAAELAALCVGAKGFKNVQEALSAITEADRALNDEWSIRSEKVTEECGALIDPLLLDLGDLSDELVARWIQRQTDVHIPFKAFTDDNVSAPLPGYKKGRSYLGAITTEKGLTDAIRKHLRADAKSIIQRGSLTPQQLKRLKDALGLALRKRGKKAKSSKGLHRS